MMPPHLTGRVVAILSPRGKQPLPRQVRRQPPGALSSISRSPEPYNSSSISRCSPCNACDRPDERGHWTTQGCIASRGPPHHPFPSPSLRRNGPSPKPPSRRAPRRRPPLHRPRCPPCVRSRLSPGRNHGKDDP
jgi:hypothetical protein